MFNLGMPEIIIILLVGVVLFGKRLPEIGRSIGKSLVEFKKGMRGIEEESEPHTHYQAANQPTTPSAEPPRPPQRMASTAPKFEE